MITVWHPLTTGTSGPSFTKPPLQRTSLSKGRRYFFLWKGHLKFQFHKASFNPPFQRTSFNLKEGDFCFWLGVFVAKYVWKWVEELYQLQNVTCCWWQRKWLRKWKENTGRSPLYSAFSTKIILKIYIFHH